MKIEFPKSVETNWHAIAIVALLVVVPVAGKYLGFTNDTILMITTALISLATASGFIAAASSASLVKTASDLSTQVDAGISSVRQDLSDMHAISAANVAAVHTAVAVQAARMGVPLPPPLTTPVEAVAPDVVKAVENASGAGHVL
jgi:hypothetical protein